MYGLAAHVDGVAGTVQSPLQVAAQDLWLRWGKYPAGKPRGGTLWGI